MFKCLRLVIISLFIVHCLLLIAQEGLIRKGNELYKNGNYSEAEVNYLKSLQKNKLYNKGLFNLGDAYYKEKNYEKAGSAFQNYSFTASDKASKSKAFYNLGNSLFQAGKFEDCINAYKNSLRYTPNDKDTKYNLSLAQRMMKQQQQQNKQNKQDKNKDNKDQQKQDQQKQDQQKQQQQKQQQQQAKQDDKKLTKQDADRMLQALNKDEKDLLKNLEKKNVQVARVKIEKNW
jgi:tetratricopeptide (TPR) repeat protein